MSQTVTLLISKVVNVKKIKCKRREKKPGLRLIHTAEIGAEGGRRKNIEEQIFKNRKEEKQIIC